MLAPREIDEYILPTERRVIRVRQHWVVLLNDMTQTALVLGGLVLLDRYLPSSLVLDNLTWYGGLVAVLRLTVLIALWWVERIVITDKRVMLAKGILTHNIGMMPLSKVTDLTFERTMTGRMMGYGTMIIESAGQIQALNRIDFMPQPEEIYEALAELIFGDKRQTRSHYLSKPRRRGYRRLVDRPAHSFQCLGWHRYARGVGTDRIGRRAGCRRAHRSRHNRWMGGGS
ncbi:MAG TPA: PH domain-containing protein [Pseudonocardia sp.]